MDALKNVASLKDKLDKIDTQVVSEVFNSFYESRLKILVGMWEKGEIIVTYRGVKVTNFLELERETGRPRQHLKKWHDFYEQYPEREEYIKEYAEPKAKEWTEKALSSPKPKEIESEWLRLYNIWNLGSIDSDKEYFGIFPSVFMENLLYYHTQENDLIYDPFTGSGTTIDACNKMNRQYYCSDLNVYAGLDEEIKKWDIKNGLPKDLSKPYLVFLDPPYWQQAKGRYSDSLSDLGNVSLGNFYAIFNKFLRSLIDWQIEKIAIVIAATQYPNVNKEFEDHIFKFHEILTEKYKIEMRYIIPYSTQQYNGTQVEVMKKERKPLNLIRDLVVWALKKE